jgi:uncharacterized protein
MAVLDGIGHALALAGSMTWQVTWSLILGFTLSAVVQAVVRRETVTRLIGGTGPRSLAIATGFGAASSSCSYAAVALARALLRKGASFPAAMAFEIASTNLVIELGIILALLISWQFTLAEFVGGLILIGLMTAFLRFFVSPQLERRARQHAQEAAARHVHHAAGVEGMAWRQRLTSLEAWTDVAHNFRGDWQMLWKEIGIGFLLAGFIGLLGDDFFNVLFVTDAPGVIRTVENVIAGPIIAVLSFVCSIGNVPLAAVLWSGGISFGGVMAFIFADLIVLPIVVAYRKYYGTEFAMRITALMFVTMVLAALIVEGLFSLAGLIPSARPARADVFGSVQLDYKLVLDLIGLAVFAALFYLTVRRRDEAARAQGGAEGVAATMGR